MQVTVIKRLHNTDVMNHSVLAYHSLNISYWQCSVSKS